MSNEFIERILDYRRMTAEVRELQQDRLVAAMHEMSSALGRMISFTNMNTQEFPVDCFEVETSSEVDVLADYGMQIIALRDGDRVSRVYANIYTRDVEEQIILSLHMSKAASKYRWLVETHSRGSDGSISESKVRYDKADDALTAVKSRMLEVATEVVSNGHYEVTENLPNGDIDAAISIYKHVDHAKAEGLRMRNLIRELREERSKVAGVITGVYTSMVSELNFLGKLGFSLEIEGERSIISTRTSAGLEVAINHGEGYRSTIHIQAVDTDPSIVSYSITDNEGRKELRSHVKASDMQAIFSEIKNLVLTEIEDAEAAWLPILETHQEETLSKTMSM